MLHDLKKETAERRQRNARRLNGEDSPVGIRHVRITGQHGFAFLIGYLLIAAAGVSARLLMQQRREFFADQLAVLVIEHAIIAIQHIKLRAVAVELAKQQLVKRAFALQVEGAADVAEIAAGF